MSEYELNKIKDKFGKDLEGYNETGKGRLRRVISYSNKRVDKHNKVICNKTIWGYAEREEWRGIFIILGGTIGEVPADIIKC